MMCVVAPVLMTSARDITSVLFQNGRGSNDRGDSTGHQTIIETVQGYGFCGMIYGACTSPAAGRKGGDCTGVQFFRRVEMPAVLVVVV